MCHSPLPLMLHFNLVINNKLPQATNDTLDSNLLIVLLIIIRLGAYLSPTISSDAATLHICKQQQIASGNKYD